MYCAVSCNKRIYFSEVHEVNKFYNNLNFILLGNVNVVRCKFKRLLLLLLFNNNNNSPKFCCLFGCKIIKFNTDTVLSSYILLTFVSFALNLYYITTDLNKTLAPITIGNIEFTITYKCLRCT